MLCMRGNRQKVGMASLLRFVRGQVLRNWMFLGLHFKSKISKVRKGRGHILAALHL